MSYIVETNTKDDFLENLTATKKNMFSVTLNQFAIFTTDAYGKKSETVLKDVIKIIYGLPSDELVKKSHQGKFALGGCCVDKSNPDWECNNCGNRF
jgi:hypothetical protein